MVADRIPTDLGKRLREAREQRGVSLRQIANATKISVGVLESLERNDISRLPSGIFSRAFVRSYAVEVGLDPEEAVRDFIAQFPHESVTAGHPTSTRVEDIEAMVSGRRTAVTVLRLVLVSVPLAGAVLYFGVVGPRASRLAVQPAARLEARPAAASGIERASAPAAAPSVAAVSPGAEVPSAATVEPSGRLTIGLSATRACWVSATVDGRKVLERLLQAGEAQTMAVDRELVLTTGDAEAIAMTINGRAARSLGARGQVVTSRISALNVNEFLPAR